MPCTFQLYNYCKYTSHRQSIRVYEGIHVNTPSSTSPCHEKIIIGLCPDVSPETSLVSVKIKHKCHKCNLWNGNARGESCSEIVMFAAFMRNLHFSCFMNMWPVGPVSNGQEKIEETLSYTKSVSTGWAGNVRPVGPRSDWLYSASSKFLTNSGPVGPGS